MAEVELLLRRYGEDLDEQCPPVTLAELEQRLESTADVPGIVDPGLAGDEAADGGGDRGRRLMMLAAAMVVLLVATVAVVVAVVGGDEDSNRVVTEEPDTPVTVETPATTVTEPPTPTTEVPLATASPAADWPLVRFAPPPAYGYPLGTLTCCEQPTEEYRFVLLGAPGEGADPFAGGDLLVLAAGANASIGPREGEQYAVRGTTGYSGRYLDFPPAGFVGELTWREEDLGVVVLASRSFTTEELIEIADSLSLDEASLDGELPVPDGYAVVADQWYADRLGPLSLGGFDDGLVPEGLTYISTWTTGGVVEQNIRVTAKPASAQSLDLVAYLVTDTSRVPVRGGTGVLGTYGGSKQLSWIDDQARMVTIMASDPSVDLVAMAESTPPPAPGSPGPRQTVLTGTREGSEWSIQVVFDAQRGYGVCWMLDGVGGNCNAVAAGQAVTYPEFRGQPVPIDGYGFFVGGAVPSCAVQVRSGSATIDTVEGPDGRRYFGSWDVNPEALFDPGTLEALDAAGATVGTWSRGGTWRDDRC